MLPDVCCSSPASIINSVDFPQPLGPTRTMNRPGLMSSEMSDSATTSAPEVLKVWPTPLIWTAPARGAGFSGVTFANGCISSHPI